MKKITFLLGTIAVLGMLGFASTSFATEDVYSDTGSITVGANDGVDDLTVGLSPKVVARYVDPGDSNSTAQWFAISTAHPGGNTIYATAQDLNNIYYKNFTTGTALSSSVLDIPATAESASTWSANNWKM